jgi:hypothetical protein
MNQLGKKANKITGIRKHLSIIVNINDLNSQLKERFANYLKKAKPSCSPVAHICNLSYSEGRDQ